MSLKSRLKQIEWLNSLYAKAYGFVYRNYTPLRRAYMTQEYKNKYYYSAPYSLKINSSSTNKVVIFNLAVHNDYYGLADRLKGAILTYSVCKKLQLDFKINYISPFCLNKFLEPNNYNWFIPDNEVCYNLNCSDIVLAIVSVIDENSTYKHIRKSVLASKKQQIHVSTNWSLKDKNEHSILFHELFKPTQALQVEIDRYLDLFGSNYINATFRFQNSLGDFAEFDMKPLAQSEQKSLIERCTTQLLKLHSSYPDKKILVTSDSITFLEHINTFDFTYIIDGRPIHMSKTDDASFDMHKKAFIDFFMISYAEKIFLFYTDNMYNSGFPRLAAWINGVPFKAIKF